MGLEVMKDLNIFVTGGVGFIGEEVMQRTLGVAPGAVGTPPPDTTHAV
jgi:nucleoside-diphosphate-sugar epimerase